LAAGNSGESFDDEMEDEQNEYLLKTFFRVTVKSLRQKTCQRQRQLSKFHRVAVHQQALEREMEQLAPVKVYEKETKQQASDSGGGGKTGQQALVSISVPSRCPYSRGRVEKQVLCDVTLLKMDYRGPM